jgi:hypothetical protein
MIGSIFSLFQSIMDVTLTPIYPSSYVSNRPGRATGISSKHEDASLNHIW